LYQEENIDMTGLTFAFNSVGNRNYKRSLNCIFRCFVILTWLLTTPLHKVHGTSDYPIIRIRPRYVV